MLRKLLSQLFDTLVPPHHITKAARLVTEEYLAKHISVQQIPAATFIHALWPYSNEKIRTLIKSMKYHGDSESGIKLGTLAADYVLELVHEKQIHAGWEVPVVVPIAASEERERKRGYNQIDAAARALASACSLPYLTALTRTDRESQVNIPRHERKRNIQGAFGALPEVKNKCVILIDDVVESGATLTDARRALLEAGATDVIAIALAH